MFGRRNLRGRGHLSVGEKTMIELQAKNIQTDIATALQLSKNASITQIQAALSAMSPQVFAEFKKNAPLDRHAKLATLYQPHVKSFDARPNAEVITRKEKDRSHGIDDESDDPSKYVF